MYKTMPKLTKNVQMNYLFTFFGGLLRLFISASCTLLWRRFLTAFYAAANFSLLNPARHDFSPYHDNPFLIELWHFHDFSPYHDNSYN